MRQAIQLSSFFLASTLLASAQPPVAKPAARKSAHPATATSGAAKRDADTPTTQLPVTRVALYKNGVGFFEHAGHVTGDQSVTIDFTTAQLNDVLQSLTAIDLNGGRIAGADYNSTTPIEQQIKALPFSLGEKATFSALFTALRGARVQVSGPGIAFTGRIVDIEMHKTGPGKGADGMIEGRFLTLASDSGEIRIVEITPAVTVHLLDDATSTNLTQFLKLLDSNRSDGLRHLTLRDNGSGTRELHVSYISEVPIWKSTYRILFTEPKPNSGDGKQTATLQGWSVVDNTTGEDWNNVQLSLIAGAPQSFIQPLSVPYYSRRTEIPLPQEAQLTPQTHESGEMAQDKVQTGSGRGSGIAAGVAGGIYGGAGRTNLNQNFRGGASQSVTVASAAPMLDTENATLGGTIDGLYQNLAQTSMAPRTTTTAFDDYFAYNLTEPITIRKNESALVPTLQAKIDAERVTLWSPREPTPLRALWITNTSNLTLDRGSFSIVEDGNFGGEGLLDPIHPAEKRLLSYAVDQAVHVNVEGDKNTTHATELTAAKGVMVLHHTQIAEITYVVHNAAAETRTVIVEHPIHAGFVLDNASGQNGQDPKPEETTPTLYRYRVITAPGETVRLHVGERHRSVVTYQLTNFNDNQLSFILNQTNNSAAVKQALEPILDARRHVAEMQAAVDNAKGTLDTLHSDEARQRENITALAGADKASRDRFVHDLNATEDQIAAAQKDLNTAHANLQAAKDDLANKIQALQIDETIG